MATVVLTSSNASWAWPSGVTSLTAEAIGGGGAGGSATNNAAVCAGGKGGSYAKVTITKGAESTLNITVGGAGAASTIVQNGSTVLSAAGGASVAANGTTGATALVGSNIGSTTFAGGDGSNSGANSGAGGGAGGPTSAGSGATAGSGTFADGATRQGAGGASVSSSAIGNAGSNYGGGGSGGKTTNNTDRAGGAGAPGVVVLTYTLPAADTFTENFDAALDTTSKWTAASAGGTWSVTSGRLRLDHDASSTSDILVYAQGNYDLNGSHFYVQNSGFTTASTAAGTEYNFAVFDGSASDWYGAGNALTLNVYWNGSSMRLVAGVRSAWAWSGQADVAYDSTNHKWLRIREASGTTVYFETAPDSSGAPGTWSTLASLLKSSITWNANFGSMKPVFHGTNSSTAQTADPGYIEYDGLNTNANSTTTTHATSGALTGPGAAVVGSAAHVAKHATSGALSGPGSAVAGSASRTRVHATDGALSGPGSSVAGSASRTRAHATSGALTGPGSSLAGSASRTREHATSGAIAGPGSAVAGAASRTRQHAATGAVAGPGAAITGDASRTGSATTHDTSGTIAGPGATLAGSASRTRAHATSGALAGPGAAIAGSSSRTRAHAASGALAGPGTSVAGAAARTRAHAASGAVAGPGAALAGAATRFASHATSGVLTGPGAAVVGAASRGAGAVAHATSGALTGAGSTISGASVRARRPAFGGNVHSGGSTTSENTEIADFLAARNLHYKVRFDLYASASSATKALVRDLVEKLNARGGSAVLIIYTQYQDDYDPTNKTLSTVYTTSYNATYTIVNEFSDICTDYEMHNEVQFRPDMEADVPRGTMQESTSGYESSDAAAYIKTFLRGQANAIAKVAADTGRPLRRIMGFAHRDWGFGTYLQQTTTPAGSPGAVAWDVTGWHCYINNTTSRLINDTWWAEQAGKTALQRMAQWGKPVTINEWNAGEIYDAAYGNTDGDVKTEDGYKSNARHTRALMDQTQCNLESLTVYELFDEPAKSAPENRFGLIRGTVTTDPAKVSLYVFTAFAGGTLTTAERNAISVDRALLTASEIDTYHIGASHAASGALVGPGAAVAGSGTKNALHGTSGALAGPGATVAGSASRSNSAKLDSIKDAFDAGTLDTTVVWNTPVNINTSSGTVSLSGGRLVMDLTSSTVGHGLLLNTRDVKDLTGTRIYARLAQALQTSGSAAGAEAIFGATVSGADSALGWHQQSDGSVRAQWRILGAEDAVSLSYTPSTHAWLAILETGGTVYWESAPSSADDPPTEAQWVIRHQKPLSELFAVTGMRIRFLTQIWSGAPGAPTQDPQWDSVNTRTRAAVTHTTSGVLAGPGSLLAGSAARKVSHASTGALIGAIGAIAAAAARARVHYAGGSLTGASSAIISGIGSTSDATRRLWVDVQDTDGAWSDSPQSSDPWTTTPDSDSSWGS